MKLQMGEGVEENDLQESKQLPEFTAGNFSLSQAMEVISSLICLSYSVKVFTAKWQLIRSKLEQLNYGLVAARNSDSGENPALSWLIPAILVTANQCSNLVQRCVDLSYSGKLLMQSDLDVILTKFDHHVKNLSRICTSGILTQNHALVVSRPSVGASRDDMKFFVRDIVSRMKVGDLDMKKQALISLHEVLVVDENYVRITAEIDDILGLLIKFLDSPDTEFQEQSSKISSVIASSDSFKGFLIVAGIIGPLVGVLESGSEKGKADAAQCLKKLTENSDNAWSVSAHGGVTALLRICSSGDLKGDLIGSACGVLKNLVGVEEIKRFMIEEGAIPTIVKLARSKDEMVQINSMELLQAMVSKDDESIRQIVIRQGGLRALVRVLDPRLSFSSKTRETALRTIDTLCFSSITSMSMLLNYEFMDHILFFLRNGEVSVQELAFKAVYKLCGASEDTKKAMGDSGFMSELVRLLESKSTDVREMAAEALSNMIRTPKNMKRFVQDDSSIITVLQLLNPEQGLSTTQQCLLSILMTVTSSNSARKKIAKSGYLKNVVKLAEAEGSDAQRVVRKLSGNRFRSLLSGFCISE